MEGGGEPRVCEGSAGVKEEDEKLTDTENTDGDRESYSSRSKVSRPVGCEASQISRGRR